MQITTHNSEKILLADLRECRIGNPTHRCLYLRFSQLGVAMDEWLPLLEKALRHSMGDAVDHFYLCHDNDVFVLGWGLTNRRLDELLVNLARDLSASSLKNIASLFEVGIHWGALESLCTKKLRNLELLQETSKKVKKPELEKITHDEAFDEIDHSLIQTIAERRKNREEPEILVVEDDIFSQTLIKNTLEKKYSLSVTDDGQGAIMNYVKNAPDIMFLDIELPDINGHEILRKIKAIDSEAFIVMFSGNGDRENVLKAIDLGAQGFVGKPFTKEKLLQYIEKSPFVKAKAQNAKVMVSA